MDGSAGTPGAPAEKTSRGKPAPPEPPEPIGFFARLERRVKRSLGPKPINRKLTSITMLVCMVALVLSGVVFFTFDFVSQVLGARASLASLALVAAENSRGPLAQAQVEPAVATLDALMAYPNVTGAFLYREDGRPFAAPSQSAESRLPKLLASGFGPGSNVGLTRFQHFEPVMQGSKNLGMLALEISLGDLWSRLRIYAIITAIVFVLASVSARLLLGRLQGMISEPIVELANLADTVARENNYALRAEKRSDDEVGHLVGTFNNMLSEIQKRDAAISEAHTGLESNVLARTSQLHKEVEERRQAEDALKDSELRYRNLFENNPMPMFVRRAPCRRSPRRSPAAAWPCPRARLR